MYTLATACVCGDHVADISHELRTQDVQVNRKSMFLERCPASGEQWPEFVSEDGVDWTLLPVDSAPLGFGHRVQALPPKDLLAVVEEVLPFFQRVQD